MASLSTGTIAFFFFLKQQGFLTLQNSSRGTFSVVLMLLPMRMVMRFSIRLPCCAAVTFWKWVSCLAATSRTGLSKSRWMCHLWWIFPIGSTKMSGASPLQLPDQCLQLLPVLLLKTTIWHSLDFKNQSLLTLKSTILSTLTNSSAFSFKKKKRMKRCSKPKHQSVNCMVLTLDIPLRVCLPDRNASWFSTLLT